MEVILEYKGEIAFDTIDWLLNRLKNLPAYQNIRKSVQKKVYSVFVECVDNLYKHRITDPLSINDEKILPYIMLTSVDDKYIISTGNVVTNDSIQDLSDNLKQINQYDRIGLKSSYAEIVNKDIISDKDGAGLGLITIALKTENKIKYEFKSIDDKYSYFEMDISI
jgi:hypothetical protein